MFKSNPLLRAEGEPVEYTKEQLEEYIRCEHDLIHFAENHVKIVTIDRGIELIKLWDFQKRLLLNIHKPPEGKRHTIILASRQVGKSVICRIELLHYILFNSDKTVAILANKEKTARKLMKELKDAYQRLPYWLQVGVRVWNSDTLEFENGVTVICSSTASSAIRSYTIAKLFLDEFAFVPDNIATEFMSSVYPTISSGLTSQITIVSTSNGLNNFFNMWQNAIHDPDNEFYPLKVKWDEVPGRDDTFRKKTIANLPKGIIQWNQEYGCISKETPITIKNKLTNELKRISIGKIYDELQNKESKKLKKFEIRKNDEYEILTPHGFCDFDGITKYDKKKRIEIVLDTGRKIICDKDHLFIIKGKEVKAKYLRNGDFLETDNEDEIIVSIKKSNKESCYDAFNVKNKDHSYFTNNIKSHNCRFIGSTTNLIDPDVLENIKTDKPIALQFNDRFLIYKHPEKNKQYVLGIDTAAGTGLDYSVIQVLQINGDNDLEQVAVFRDNMIDIHEFAEVCVGVSEYYNHAQMMVENNGVGKALVNELFYTHENENLVNLDPKGLGINANKETKADACTLIKNYIENKWLKIHDQTTLYELSRFIEIRKNVFQCQEKTGHDDTVSGLYWANYFVKTPYYDAKGFRKANISDEYTIQSPSEDDEAPAIVFDEGNGFEGNDYSEMF